MLLVDKSGMNLYTKNPRNYGTTVYSGSCRVSSINHTAGGKHHGPLNLNLWHPEHRGPSLDFQFRVVVKMVINNDNTKISLIVVITNVTKLRCC